MSEALRRYRQANPLPEPKSGRASAPEQSPLEPWPIADANNYNGWLGPDGTFYTCCGYEHEDFAWRLAERYGYQDYYSGSKALEENGWVKLKSGDWIVVLLDELTQKQIDALFDWCQAKGRTLESLELL